MQRDIDQYGVEWRKIEVNDTIVNVSEKGELDFVNSRGVRYKGFGDITPLGYKRKTINKVGYMVSRIVAKAFLDDTLPLRRKDNPADQREVDHINTRDDNSLLNIRIVGSHKSNCRTPESRRRYEEANGTMCKCGWLGYQAYKGTKKVAEFTGRKVYEQIMRWLNEQNIYTTPNSLKSSIIGTQTRVGAISAFGYCWKRIKDENYQHHKYHEYQREYHRRWRAKQKEKHKEA